MQTASRLVTASVKHLIAYRFFWLIIAIATVLRTYKLGQIPYGLGWDEASILYNAWGISLWHRDEWANLMPLAFRSFGDYKAPLMFYLLAVPFKLFGVIEPLIRYFSAVAGILTVAGMYLLTVELTKSKPTALVAATLTALSPWAINISRVGFEANLALALTVWGAVFLYKSQHTPWLMTPAAIMFVASLYAYHSTKIFLPAFLLFYTFSHFHRLIKFSRQTAVAIGVGFLAVLPLIYVTFFGQGFERGLTMIFFDQNHQLQSLPYIGAEFIKNFINQFTLDFLIGGRDAVGLRHLTPGHGIMYWIEVPFFILGLIFLMIHYNKSKPIILWLTLGLLPALLSHQTPHALRSLLFLPGLIITTAHSFTTVVQFLKKRQPPWSKIFIATVSVALVVQLASYQHTYYTTYAVESAASFQYGYQEAIKVSTQMGKTREKIVMTDFYGQPYIFVLLYNRITPEQFLSGALANYEFHTFNWPYYKPNSVIVGTPDEIPITDAAVKHIVYVPGTSEPMFVIAETPKE